jgi:hypothetical protein
MFNRHCRLAVSALALAALTGCGLMTPPYQASVQTAEALKTAPTPMAVGAFTVQPGLDGTSIGLRAASMKSSVGGDYAAYLAEALRKELALATRLDPNSRLEISGVLLKNDIAAAGISTNSGEMQARFLVRRDGAVRYERTLDASLSWESSFFGGVAISAAQAAYPRLAQKLIGTLVADPAFQAAIR